MVKYISIIFRPPKTNRKEVIDYWLNTHSVLVKSLLPELQKYVINIVAKEDEHDENQCDGVVEMHFSDMEALQRSLASPAWQSDRRKSSSEKVIDYNRMNSFIVEEHVIPLNR